MAENNNIDTLVILVVADEQLSELTHKLVAGACGNVASLMVEKALEGIWMRGESR